MPTVGTNGDDNLTGPGKDLVQGLDGNDTLTARAGDTLEGGHGDDRLVGEWVSYQHASGPLNVDLRISGPQAVGGGEGVDTLVKVIAVVGGDYGDTLVAADAFFTQLFGAGGDDSLAGGKDTYRLEGGAGADTIVGSGFSGGLQYILGGDGDDDLTQPFSGSTSGDAGNDRISTAGPAWGGAGDDTIVSRGEYVYLAGGDGDDRLVGDAKNNTISGGSGSNVLIGNAGDDKFALFDSSMVAGNNTIDGGQGVDEVSFSETTDRQGRSGAPVYADLSAGVAHVLPFTQTVIVSNYPRVTAQVDSPAGDVTLTSVERLFGGNGDDTLIGSSSSDTMSGSKGADRIFGGDGNDWLESDGGYGTGDGSSYLRGEGGDDTLTGGDAFDDIQGNTGNDVEYGGEGGDWVVGGKDNDTLYGNGGNDILNGNLGNDTLDGGESSDTVRGGQGDDVITGGVAYYVPQPSLNGDWLSGDLGNDTITGGVGPDIFHTFSTAGIDKVTDFSTAEGDRVQLDPGTAYALAQVGSDTVVDMGDGNQMILVGVEMSSLPEGWIFYGPG